MAYNIELIFVPETAAKLDSQGVKVDERGAVTFYGVEDFEPCDWGLTVNFNGSDQFYGYPWHQIARFKVWGHE